MLIKDLKQYVLTSDHTIYRTNHIATKIMEVNDSLGFWQLKRNKIQFVYIIKTSDNYLEMRKTWV